MIKRIWALVLLVISLFFLRTSTTCKVCFGCSPTLLEPCSVIFMLVFLGLFAWSIVIFRDTRKVLVSKKKKL